ncbi:hypothetical protein Y032_0074g903 [Ancylostoma ceylanicum]|uniref:SCP domain-containing protein n=1 Tax=Ancylostoma ceylanicum TaxID=53326 RepID=A0A016TVZ4_9BILA|nr:hypothetical protein Y032_0074g903 [Ancylostoma ceylanicum]
MKPQVNVDGGAFFADSGNTQRDRNRFPAATANYEIFIMISAPFCSGGKAAKEQVNEVLKLVNDRRTLLVEGKQKNGNSGNQLPPAKGMTKIGWSCELEKAATKNLNSSCPNVPPGDGKGRAEIIKTENNTSNENLATVMGKVLASIDTKTFSYLDTPALHYTSFADANYANLVRSTTTELGCVFKTCPEGKGENYTLYCLTNQKPVAVGDVIYEVGTGVCSGCPQGTFCEVDSKLCAPTLDAPPGETIFKDFKCRNSLIAEEWRTNMLEVHNENRRRLAKGSQKGEGGALLPTAKNMNELIWDCSLEDAAYERAAECTETVTPPDGYGAVSSMITTKANPCNATSMAEQAVQDIWEKGSEKQANNTKVAGNDDFSQMAYYKTNGIGCSYSWCDGKLSLVCLYNKDGSAKSVKKLFIKGGAGDTCKRCEPNNNQDNCVNGLCQVPLSYVHSPSTICPKNAVSVTDNLRTIALDMHNYYRRQLAMGWAKDKQITYAKAAAAMPELVKCSFE